MATKINQDKCTSCGTCVPVCPVQAIELPEGAKASIKESECIDCAACVDECQQQAITPA